MLPTINTGEPLRLDSNVPYRSPEDPFKDSSAVSPGYTDGYNARSQRMYTQQESPSDPFVDNYSRAQTPYTMQSHSQFDGELYSRPASAYSSYDFPQPPATPYDRATSLSPGDQRSAVYHLPTHYGSRGEVISDRLENNETTYTSGAYASMSRRQMRSRSATPMGDDEFYANLANNSFEFNAGNRSFDVEKNASSYDLGDSRNHYMSTHAEEDEEKALKEKVPSTIDVETPVTTQHFGPAPIGRVTRRHKLKKTVQLTKGNLVVELDVPSKLVQKFHKDKEMKITRYTAVTGDPDDFSKSNFSLRQNELGRTTEMFIVVTMYNVRYSKLELESSTHEMFLRKMKYYSVGLC